MDGYVVVAEDFDLLKASVLVDALRKRGPTTLVRLGSGEGAPEMPACDFELDSKSKQRVDRQSSIVRGLGRKFRQLRPRWVVSLGDDDGAVAAALAADWSGCPLAHVEAGARAGDLAFPGERNRLLVEALSEALFCSAVAHSRNIPGRTVVYVGDLLADVAVRFAGRIRRHAQANRDGAIIYLQEPESLPADAVDTLARTGTRPIVVPRAEVQSPLDLMERIAGARLVLTDDADAQKAAYLLGVYCLTLAPRTKCAETVAAGWNVLASMDTREIVAAGRTHPTLDRPPPIYGEGNTATQIARHLPPAG